MEAVWHAGCVACRLFGMQAVWRGMEGGRRRSMCVSCADAACAQSHGLAPQANAPGLQPFPSRDRDTALDLDLTTALSRLSAVSILSTMSSLIWLLGRRVVRLGLDDHRR